MSDNNDYSPTLAKDESYNPAYYMTGGSIHGVLPNDQEKLWNAYNYALEGDKIPKPADFVYNRTYGEKPYDGGFYEPVGKDGGEPVKREGFQIFHKTYKYLLFTIAGFAIFYLLWKIMNNKTMEKSKKK